jgi:hypothetical protein
MKARKSSARSALVGRSGCLRALVETRLISNYLSSTTLPPKSPQSPFPRLAMLMLRDGRRRNDGHRPRTMCLLSLKRRYLPQTFPRAIRIVGFFSVSPGAAFSKHTPADNISTPRSPSYARCASPVRI